MKSVAFKFSCFFLFAPAFFFGFLTQGFLNQYPNRYFVETGTWVGNGVISAQQAGFAEIHSIELSERYYSYCKEMFHGAENVHLWLGDSGALLADVIRDMHEPITFWLDGHFSGNDTAQGIENTPILKELEAIRQHPIKTHTLLIDDVRLFGSAEFDFVPLHVIVQKIREINPNYIITFADGHPFPRDILVAYVR